MCITMCITEPSRLADEVQKTKLAKTKTILPKASVCNIVCQVIGVMKIQDSIE